MIITLNTIIAVAFICWLIYSYRSQRKAEKKMYQEMKAETETYKAILSVLSNLDKRQKQQNEYFELMARAIAMWQANRREIRNLNYEEITNVAKVCIQGYGTKCANDPGMNAMYICGFHDGIEWYKNYLLDKEEKNNGNTKM
ncbi:MAG: hypothetical protein NC344_05710 [Bacteroidales bacterium]|nr:hypothetical protein [Bacteroidales bacterium]MCM1147316.1 hypothetical protein [Bacteroidales bacterium]MCM1206250.1 hypothetical protein [Bacillota bacterium]